MASETTDCGFSLATENIGQTEKTRFLHYSFKHPFLFNLMGRNEKVAHDIVQTMFNHWFGGKGELHHRNQLTSFLFPGGLSGDMDLYFFNRDRAQSPGITLRQIMDTFSANGGQRQISIFIPREEISTIEALDPSISADLRVAINSLPTDDRWAAYINVKSNNAKAGAAQIVDLECSNLPEASQLDKLTRQRFENCYPFLGAMLNPDTLINNCVIQVIDPVKLT